MANNELLQNENGEVTEKTEGTEVQKISAGTVARTICLALALVNTVLGMAGYQTINVGDETINMLIDSLFIIGAAGAAWWKNNDITKKARTKSTGCK